MVMRSKLTLYMAGIWIPAHGDGGRDLLNGKLVDVCKSPSLPLVRRLDVLNSRIKKDPHDDEEYDTDDDKKD